MSGDLMHAGQGFGVLDVIYGISDESFSIFSGITKTDIEALTVQSALSFVVPSFE